MDIDTLTRQANVRVAGAKERAATDREKAAIVLRDAAMKRAGAFLTEIETLQEEVYAADHRAHLACLENDLLKGVVVAMILGASFALKRK